MKRRLIYRRAEEHMDVMEDIIEVFPMKMLQIAEYIIWKA
jgi:hypothetical protein